MKKNLQPISQKNKGYEINTSNYMPIKLTTYKKWTASQKQLSKTKPERKKKCQQINHKY